MVLVWLTGTPPHGVGPHDVAIALCGEVYKNGFVKNKVMEFFGPGVAHLPMDYRTGIDVMTTETACLSSIWETDQNEGLPDHPRTTGGFMRPEAPPRGRYYDSLITIDLSTVECTIALPMHPRPTPIPGFKANPGTSCTRWKGTRRAVRRQGHPS